jgi:hypothetical protein
MFYTPDLVPNSLSARYDMLSPRFRSFLELGVFCLTVHGTIGLWVFHVITQPHS